MYYCPTCRVLSTENICPACGSGKLQKPKTEDPVLLITVDEKEAERMEAAFSGHSIPFDKQLIDQSLSAEGATIRIFVPFGKLEETQELLADVGLLKNEDQPDETEKMSRKKKVFWRILSVILFILAVWGIVTAADYAASIMKDFLSNL